MRLAQLEQTRRSPNRSPTMSTKTAYKREASNKHLCTGSSASKKLKMKTNDASITTDANRNASSTTTPTAHHYSSSNEGSDANNNTTEEICGGSNSTQTPSRNTTAVNVTKTPLTNAIDDNDTGSWEYIDEAENIVFQFQENEDPSGTSLPYTLEVIWIHDDHEYFIANDASSSDAIAGAAGGSTSCDCSEKFIPLIESAVRRAMNMTTFMVRYNNKLDRTWPYTKVMRVAEVVSRVKGKDAVLESVDDDYFEYIVNLVPRKLVGKSSSSSKKKKKGIDGSSFVGDVDFSHMDDIKKYYVLDYIGGDAMELM